jgi:hypothetical protein
MNDEKCQVELSSDSTEFRITRIKSYYENAITQQDKSIEKEILRTQSSEITSENENSFLSDENLTSLTANVERFLRIHISVRQNAADVFFFIQDSAISSVTSFKESRKNKIDDLLERNTFQLFY